VVCVSVDLCRGKECDMTEDCDMTDAYVLGRTMRHDSFVCVAARSDMTHSYVSLRRMRHN